MANGRYLLFLDILGFSELVETRGHEDVYATIEKALEPFHRWERLNGQFRTIYFSDTFVYYQESKGYGDWAFLDIYAIGGMVLSALLAARIPARGAISFGEFEVKSDSSSRHQLYFGRAMVEAYRAEQREKWIGITILPSAWKPYDTGTPGIIDQFASEKVWLRREDDVLLLNPFIKLRSWRDMLWLPGEVKKPYSTHDAPEFPNDILGLKFLRETAAAYANRNDFLSPAAVKYHVTIAYLKKVLGEELFDWAEQASKPENFD
ncbi:MAG TPA: hypothetical protein DCY64_23305 [Hydrogenophaga sp.]|nr:MAG: hypothetical protein A2X73_14365 [Burkholderiales bacterium GWE1_65_30]OGA92148.1 MAG: hypothetical protein A2X72_08615 [Burkholderiales bacterium GWF1_66_17]HAX23194.1 hypothetical protein [Hydrogenophaga sp.]HBU17547.1 hypothetical protein [Hydrogenophaga sp.]